MAGTVWNDVNTGREVFSMTHLHPQLHKVEVVNKNWPPS